MTGRTTPKKPGDFGYESTYNQVDKDEIEKQVLQNRLAQTVAVAVDAMIGYQEIPGPNGLQAVLVDPNPNVVRQALEKTERLSILLVAKGATVDVDQLRAAHLRAREQTIETEHAHWSTMLEHADLFDEPDLVIRQNLQRVSRALAAVRAALETVPVELRAVEDIEDGEGGE